MSIGSVQSSRGGVTERFLEKPEKIKHFKQPLLTQRQSLPRIRPVDHNKHKIKDKSSLFKELAISEEFDLKGRKQLQPTAPNQLRFQEPFKKATDVIKEQLRMGVDCHNSSEIKNDGLCHDHH